MYEGPAMGIEYSHGRCGFRAIDRMQRPTTRTCHLRDRLNIMVSLKSRPRIKYAYANLSLETNNPSYRTNRLSPLRHGINVTGTPVEATDSYGEHRDRMKNRSALTSCLG